MTIKRGVNPSYPFDYLLDVGKNTNVVCHNEKHNFHLLKGYSQKLIQLDLEIIEMHGYQFGGCIYGSIIIYIDDLSPIEFCSYWPEISGRRRVTFLSSIEEISIRAISFIGMFRIKARVNIAGNDCQGVLLPSEIIELNIAMDGVKRSFDEDNYEYITYVETKQLFIEPKPHSCVIVHTFPHEIKNKNISFKNRKYQIHVTTFVGDTKEIPVKMFRVEVYFYIPSLTVNEKRLNDCKHFGYVFFEERLAKRYNLITGYNKFYTLHLQSHLFTQYQV